jgi:zinc transport system permease protein
MHWLIEPFSQPFMVRAMIAGTAVGGLCAALGVFVVQRGLSFLGDGLAHVTFGGIALALLLGLPLERMTWVALPYTVLVAVAIMKILRRRGLGGDVVIGVLSAVSFALGVILIGLRSASSPAVNVETVLFGSILAVSAHDLAVVLAVTAVTAALLAVTWTRLAYATFDSELAALSGVRVRMLDYMLMCLTAIVIVVAVKTVGVVLVSSFIVIPAAMARMLARSFGRMAIYSVTIGVPATAAGLLLSYHLNVASGATIILTLGTLFGFALFFRVRSA